MGRDRAGDERDHGNDGDPPPRAATLVAERLGPVVAAAGTYAAVEGRPGPVAVARELRGLEPEERFTASAGRLGALLGVESGDGDTDAREHLLRYDAYDARRRGRATDVDPSSLDGTDVEGALDRRAGTD